MLANLFTLQRALLVLKPEYSGVIRLKLIEAEWRIYTSVNLPLLVKIMTCRLIGAKPLSEPLLEYC